MDINRTSHTASEDVRTVLITGATRNFFKVGHAAIHVLSRRYPSVRIRLGVPDVENAKPACKGANVEFAQWEPGSPETLKDVFNGCTAVLIVPPIKDRVDIGRFYISQAKQAGLKFICCIGVQHGDPRLLLSREANTVKEDLAASGIPHCTLELPMFLENLLYQARSIKKKGEFYYPCRPESRFSYVGCTDLGEVVARMLATGETYEDTRWTAMTQTSCAELAEVFSRTLGRKIRFVQIPEDQFIEGLLKDGGSAASRHAAERVLELWNEIDAGRDLRPTDTFAKILGRTPMTAAEWVEEHACCFTEGRQCEHPQPPRKHGD
jgi:uncharacterized protein YbjT (DUF2867 family)